MPRLSHWFWFQLLSVSAFQLFASPAPFPSWRNLQTDFGAVGDGRADDTAALQRALDQLSAHTNFCVLYLPAGTYRLTATVQTLRKQHTDCQGIAIIGASPDTTVLQWDGPDRGTMFHLDAWYSKISRLGFDGRGRARVGLHYGPAFSTYNETSDLAFRDLGVGLLFGGPKSQGQAENEVLRCRFLRCAQAGVETANFNSMDIWVWYSRFEDCGHALFNLAGNFHAWQNLFLRSRVADIGSQNLMVFSFVNNTSIGSRRFLDFQSGHSWGSPTTISGNRILDPTANFPLRLGNGGPYLVMDNLFELPPGSTNCAAQMTWGDQTFIGNTYNTTNTVKEAGRFLRLDEHIVGDDVRSLTSLELKELGSPHVVSYKSAGPIIEVEAGADAAAIQAAINHAAACPTGAVVHLPMGTYSISQTLVVPPEVELQLVGDSAGETGTRLNWTGRGPGPLLKLLGPSHATLRDLHLHAGNGSAILVEDADQPGGHIFADQLNVSGPSQRTEGRGQKTADRGQRTEHGSLASDLRPLTSEARPAPAALRIQGLRQTDVLLRCLQGSGNAATWVQVIGQGEDRSGETEARGQRTEAGIQNSDSLSASGGESQGEVAPRPSNVPIFHHSLPSVPSFHHSIPPTNQVSILTGATSSARGQYEVRNGASLVVRGLYHEKSTDSLRGLYLSDSGTLAIDTSRFSYTTSPKSPLVAVDNFRGLLTLATSQLLPVGSTNTCRFELTGNGAAASVLALNDLFWEFEPGVTTAKVWLNRATPPAAGALLGCNMNAQRNILPGGFGFLDNIPSHPGLPHSAIRNPQSAMVGSAMDATLNPQLSTLLERHLSPLRTARIWLPGKSRPGITNLRLYRVMATGGGPAVVQFQAAAVAARVAPTVGQAFQPAGGGGFPAPWSSPDAHCFAASRPASVAADTLESLPSGGMCADLLQAQAGPACTGASPDPHATLASAPLIADQRCTSAVPAQSRRGPRVPRASPAHAPGQGFASFIVNAGGRTPTTRRENCNRRPGCRCAPPVVQPNN